MDKIPSYDKTVPEFKFDDELLSKPLDECLKSRTFAGCLESLQNSFTFETIFKDVFDALALPFDSFSVSVIAVYLL